MAKFAAIFCFLTYFLRFSQKTDKTLCASHDRIAPCVRRSVGDAGLLVKTPSWSAMKSIFFLFLRFSICGDYLCIRDLYRILILARIMGISWHSSGASFLLGKVFKIIVIILLINLFIYLFSKH